MYLFSVQNLCDNCYIDYYLMDYRFENCVLIFGEKVDLFITDAMLLNFVSGCFTQLSL